jgi:hypothetical protein
VRFPAGTLIDYTKSAPRGRKATHADCDSPSELPLEDAYGTSREAARGSYEVRTCEGTFYRNYAGRCEDAPCCGCCTI